MDSKGARVTWFHCKMAAQINHQQWRRICWRYHKEHQIQLTKKRNEKENMKVLLCWGILWRTMAQLDPAQLVIWFDCKD